MTPVTNDRLQRAFATVEAEVDVVRWSSNGIPLWPLVQSQITLDNFFMYGRGPSARSPRFAMARDLARSWRARLADVANDERLRAASVLFYGDGVSYAKIDGAYHDRLCDPLRDRLAARGVSTAFVVPLARYLVPRHSPSFFLQPRLDRARLLARLDRAAPVAAPDFARAAAILRAAIPGLRVRQEAHFGVVAKYFTRFEEVHGRVLDRVKPRLVFVVSYYGTDAMALVRECHARSIPTVDIQHGCINASHWAYVWRDRFDVVPDHFWVWSDDEAAVIRAWGGSAVVGGNPLLERWRDRPVPPRTDPRKHVLYTLNGFESDAELARLAALVAASRDRLAWWVRPHPATPRAPRIEGAIVDRDPIHATLRRMDVHVTEASSTVVEAEALGIPSVILDEGEAVMYARSIARGAARVAPPDRILETIEAILTRPPPPRRAVDVDAALSRLCPSE